jgi:exopolysaccharide biosynthesis protein
MDFILYEPVDQVLWLLEVKDYTTSPRMKNQCIFEEIAEKTRDSLALLLAGSVRDAPSNAGVGAFMNNCATLRDIKIVLHLEQPSKPSRLFPGAKIKADSTQMLRNMLKAIDPHASVTSTTSCDMKWKTQWTG